ncbi:hypothetical protein [Parabacteroides provencensis]|uniref:hypothetical protein n=1 Tax=Parabacteroides provencensis TaxID=1944636 RepID=UPI000C1578B1|nr:hypothetical protein [Parabacteroides provencensis]
MAKKRGITESALKHSKKVCDPLPEFVDRMRVRKLVINAYRNGYVKFQSEIKERQAMIKVHCLTRNLGDQTYFFTKDDRHCICVEYKSGLDFGNGSPSGARLAEIEIHTNNAFNFQYIPKVQLSDVPECILELLTYLK